MTHVNHWVLACCKIEKKTRKALCMMNVVATRAYMYIDGSKWQFIKISFKIDGNKV